jgi:hypothetical protein
MCFGGNDSPPSPPSYPAVPPPEELMDVIDHVTGTQAVTVIGADGKKKRVIERLPRTPEEQQLYEQAGDLMNRAITEIQRLNAYDPGAVVDFAPFVQVMTDLNTQRQQDIQELTNLPDFNQTVQAFKAMNQRLLEEDFKRQENEGQEYLSRRGYGDSTAAIEMRNTLGKNRAEALEESRVRGDLYGQQLKAADLSNRQTAYDLREQGRMGQLQRAQMEHQLRLDQKNQRDQARQQALQNQNDLFRMGAGIRGEDVNRAMATRAPDLANTIFQQSNMDSLNRHNAQINQINAQYQNQMAHYQAQAAAPPSFGDTLLRLGGQAGMGYFTGGMSGLGMAGGMAGTQLASNAGRRR